MPMPEILEVTDGTAAGTVSFLNEGSGFVLKEWEPKIAQPKDGGVYKDSGIADGRQLAMIRYENVDEEFILAVTGKNPKALYRNMRKLRALLLKANTYWLSGFAYEPVWLKIKGKDEVYPRYSVIAGWSYEAEGNPFHPPMSGPITNAVLDDWSLFIERKPAFTDTEPGTDTDIEASVTYTYDGRTLGNVDDAGVRDPTTAAEVFFTNKHLFTNLTDIYENVGAAWSPNLLDAALPHRLLPAVPAVNNAIYFGIDTTSATPGPYSSLIFDIATAVAGVTGVWEYWNGGAWAAFPAPAGWNYLADNTIGFSVTGVLGVFWDHPGDWAANAVNGVNAWWVRFRVTVAAGATGGSQQNRDIYSCTWPYIEIQNDQIEGELPALLNMRVRNESNYDDDTDYQKYIDWLLCGARGVDRGADFTAYIPLADVQPLPGATINLAANAAYADDMQFSPRGRIINCTAASPAGSSWIYVTLDNTIANQYKGRFRLFLRSRGGAADEWDVQIRTRAFGNLWLSDVVGQFNTTDVAVKDFGSINLPPAGFGDNETVEEIEFFIDADHVAGASTLKLLELIVIPADEFIGSFYGSLTSHGDYGPNLFGTNYLQIDSVTFPKKLVYCPVRQRATDYLESQWTNANAGPFQLEGERRTRLWFLAQNPHPVQVLQRYASHSYSHDVQLAIARQYFSAIGENL